MLKQTFAAEGKTLQRQAGGYAYAKQLTHLTRVVKRKRTILGILISDAKRKILSARQCFDSYFTEHLA